MIDFMSLIEEWIKLFSTSEMAAFYQVSEQTIRGWAKEFSDYLSPTSNPGLGKSRQFVPEDFTILGVVAQMKEQKKPFEDIHFALQSGQRAEPPDLSANDLKVLAATEGEKRAALEIQVLQRHIIDLQERLNRAEERAERSKELEIKNARLEARLESLSSQGPELEQLRAEIRRLEREIGEAHGQAYIKGYKDGLREQGDKDSDS